MSYRQRDSTVEKEIGKFLDIYFYPKISKDFKRFENKENQLAGIDIQFTLSETGTIIVDEKAATHYINKDIPTFAFELSFKLSSGQAVQGWLLDESKKTEYYLLLWIKASKTWDLVLDDINEVKAILIDRFKVIKYLESEGYNSDKLERAVTKIRNNKLDGALGKNPHSSIYFYSTLRLTEEPINVIIKRKKLEELALYSYVITKNHIKQI